jgi:hypothetical protein
MAYSITNPTVGALQIANIDAGVTMPNGSSAIPTPPLTLGMIVKAYDPTYGEGEFILLAGVASTAVGSLVVWDGTTYATTLVANSANQARPVAVAMAANTSASTFAWYQIGGTAVVKKTTVAIAPKVAVGIGGVGVLGNTASGKEVLGARSANTATVVSATTTINVVLNRPHAQGRVT